MDCPQCGEPLKVRHHLSPGSAEAHPDELPCRGACHELCPSCDRGLCSGEC